MSNHENATDPDEPNQCDSFQQSMDKALDIGQNEDDLFETQRRNNASGGENEEIVHMFQDIAQHVVNIKKRLAEQEKTLCEQEARKNELEHELNDLSKTVADLCENRCLLSESWKSEFNNLMNTSYNNQYTQMIKNAFVNGLCVQLKATELLYELLTVELSDDYFDGSMNLLDMIRHAMETGAKIRSERNELATLVSQKDILHQNELAEMQTTLQQKYQKRLEDALANNNEKHVGQLRAAIEHTMQQEEEKFEQMLTVKQAIIEEMEKKIEKLSQLEMQLKQKDTVVTELKNKLNKTQVEISQIRQETESKCEENWKKDVESHREQVKQHARTICVMEDRLLNMVKQVEDTRNELQNLTDEHSALQSEYQLLQNRFNNMQRNQVCAEPDVSFLQSAASKYDSQDIRSELLKLKSCLEERESTICTLKSDLHGAKTRLSDMRSELKESHKEEMENVIAHATTLSEDLSKSRIEADQLGKVCKELKRKLLEREGQIKENSRQIENLQQELEREQEHAAKLEACIQEERKYHQSASYNVKSQEKKWTALCAIGAACRENRHHEIINKQKEALDHLRRRLQISKPDDVHVAGSPLQAEICNCSPPTKTVLDMRRTGRSAASEAESLRYPDVGCPDSEETRTHPTRNMTKRNETPRQSELQVSILNRRLADRKTNECWPSGHLKTSTNRRGHVCHNR